MPKKIKSKGLEKHEKRNRIIALFAMIASFAMGGLLLALMKALDGDSDPSKAICIGNFAAYCVFLILTAVHFVHGLIVWKKKENYGVLFSSIGSGIAAFSALLNIRFELSMLFSSLGMEEKAEKIVGGVSFETFMAGQRSAWSLMLFGMGLSMLLGVIAIIRLTKK